MARKVTIESPFERLQANSREDDQKVVDVNASSVARLRRRHAPTPGEDMRQLFGSQKHIENGLFRVQKQLI
jgi:hypothetical protein